MAIDERLANKGKKEPRAGLVQQGRVSVGLAKEHDAELVKNGWPAAKTAELEAGVAMLQTQASVKADAAGSARGATSGEGAALTAAKAFKRRLHNALPAVLRDAKVAGVTAQSFHVGGKLGRSTPKVSSYLNKISGSVRALDEPLKPHFNGELASEVLAKAKTALDEADTTQELAITSLPLETQKVYEAKGRVLELIEDLNRAGKNAFDGQAVVMARFNKDLLLRARKERGAGEPTEG